MNNIRVNRLYETCKLCNNDQLRFLCTSSQTGLPIMHCAACDLFFIGKVFSFAEQQAFYNQYDTYRRFAEAERSVPEVTTRHREWLDLIEHHFIDAKGRKPRLLDVGCGAGGFLAVARERGFEVHGLDISVPASQLAAEWYGIEVEVGTIEDDPHDAFFDVVAMIGLLEHVIDPKATLEHAHRLLTPRGGGCSYTRQSGERMMSLQLRWHVQAVGDSRNLLTATFTRGIHKSFPGLH